MHDVMPPSFPRWLVSALALLTAALISPPTASAEGEVHTFPSKPASAPTVIEGQTSAAKPGGTTDHSKLKQLQGPFATGPEVTKACLECHTEAGKHVMKSLHWKWDFKNPGTGQQLGKKHLVNNFCTNARGNEGMCAQCHISYDYKDSSFDFSNQGNIDCLVCHDRTGTYYKTPTTKGNAACSVMFEGKPEIDLAKVARAVGMPGRENCGRCHFNGGGDDNAKHGDLSSALIAPDKVLDVHMDAKGLNFACTACHVTVKHIPAGSRYDVHASDPAGKGKPGLRRDVATCQSCHGTRPHPGQGLNAIKLNGHADTVACQTCHIPTFARGGVATMTSWDWRTAGKLNEKGEGYYEKNFTQSNGEHRKTYKSIKGSFTFAENVVPEYAWFDGQMQYTTIDTVFDPTKSVAINSFKGSHGDAKSRIWPFKRMQTVMPYDAGRNTLVYTHLWGEDDAAYWGNYDFPKAVAAGMKKNDLPFSGKLGFIDTHSYWPITHMVTTKDKALDCNECHSKSGRLAALPGFYMPGRDGLAWLDMAGYLALAGALAGVMLHGLLRLVVGRRSHTEHS